MRRVLLSTTERHPLSRVVSSKVWTSRSSRPRTARRHLKPAGAQCRSRAARLEHAGHGRLRVPRQSAPHARRRRAQGGVLHHRERRRAHRACAACRRQRIHHEAVRQGHRDGQVPGSRIDLIRLTVSGGSAALGVFCYS